MSVLTHTELEAKHYEDVWGQPGTPINSTRGRRHELPAEFRVLEFAPRAGRNTWTYATCGMSLETDERPLELHLFTLEKSLDAAEVLFMTAHFHRTGSRLWLGHSVNFGRPWTNDSPSEHGLVSLPYLDGPDLEDLELPNGRNAKFFWLIPVTRAEIEFRKEFGLEKLEERFEEANFNYADPHRESVCA